MTLKAMNINKKEVLSNINKKAMSISEEITILDNVSLTTNSTHPRYSEYYYFPRLDYSIKYRTIKTEMLSIRLGINPWSNAKGNMVEILKSIGIENSGGHKGIAGGTIKEEDEPEITLLILTQLHMLGGK